jgi:hypothetical protein
MLYVAAVPVASYISIKSPIKAEAGSVKVLAAEVATKYLLLATKVILDETEEEVVAGVV